MYSNSLKQVGNARTLIMVILFSILLFGLANKSFAAGELTLGQKELYYSQYGNIIEEAKLKYPEADLSLKPFEEFKTDEWIEAEDFAQIVEDMVNAEFELVINKPGISPLSTSIHTKQVSTTINGSSVIIYITGSFNTQISGGVQKFSGINSLVSSGSKGHWTQTGYSKTPQNNNQTYLIEVTGKWEFNGAQQGTKNVSVKFYCSDTGLIS